MRYLVVFIFIFCQLQYFFAQSNLDITQILSQEKVDIKEEVIINHTDLLNSIQNKYDRLKSETLFLPINKELTEFKIVPNELVDEAFRRENPNVLTFDLQGVNQKHLVGALTLSHLGVFALILDKGKMISIYPDNINQVKNHIVEYGFKPDLDEWKNFCGHDHTMERDQPKMMFGRSIQGIQIGTDRKSYRLAIVTTGEYYQANGNNNIAVRNKVIADVNAISAIFKNEMSITLLLGNRITLFTDPNTDPFIPNAMEDRPGQAAREVANAYPNNTIYDIGHVFHKHTDGDGWRNGGIAALSSVCSNAPSSLGGVRKAAGWSGAFNNDGNGWLSLATHEFGHQFGANHTFNGTGESCTDAISLNNAYEIASGTTIMSYQGICQDDNNIQGSGALDNYFHYASLLEIHNFANLGSGSSCAFITPSDNLVPELSANPCLAPELTIPRNTPFYVKAEGRDGDEDFLTYTWEQFDEDGPGVKPTQGNIGSAAANSSVGPLFRSFPPSSSNDRYFPSLNILRQSPSTDPFEVLPNTARKLNFVAAVRDNNPEGGAVSTDEISINVSANGPLLVSNPVPGSSVTAGNLINISWNTNGTNSLCNLVRIKLSVDGGFNYNLVLAENITYASGVHSFVLPPNLNNTSLARVMVECMDYDCIKFFAVSTGNFRINSTCLAEENFVCPTTPISLDAGSPDLNLDMFAINGKQTTAMSGTLTQNSPMMAYTVYGTNGVSCQTIPGVVRQHVQKRFTAEKTGSYTFFVQDGFVTIFRASGFNVNNPCSGGAFVGSSGRWAGADVGNGTNISQFSAFTVTLTACTEYVIAFYHYSSFPNTVNIIDINGAGVAYETNIMPNSDYALTHIAVNTTTGIIAYQSPNADFTNAVAGEYLIYSVSYKSGGGAIPPVIDPNTWIGRKLSDIQLGDCIYLSSNSRPLTVISSCTISLQPGMQTPCVPGINTYTMDIEVQYDQEPETGQLSVNGQLFPIQSSPQIVTLVGLDSDGLPVDVEAFFTDNPNCRITIPSLFTAPQNCCPITLELGEDIVVCEGDEVVVDAGDDGISYIWSRNGVPVDFSTNSIIIFASGLYSVVVTHVSGCTKSDSLNVEFIDIPQVVMPSEIEICENDNYIITPVIVGSPTTIEWYKDNVLISGENMGFLEVNSGGIYKIVVKNSLDCSSEASVEISIVEPPVVNLGANREVCQGLLTILNAGNQGVNYTWLFNGNIIPDAMSSTYTVPDGQSGVYTVIVANSGDCTSTDEIQVSFFQSPEVSMVPLIQICDGETAPITATASLYETFVWKFNGVVFIPSNGLTHIASNSGLYTFEAINNIGCITTGSTILEVNPNPVVDLGMDLVACVGGNVNLNAGVNGTSYVWTRDNLPLAENNSVISVTTSGIYAVTVTNNFNCQATDIVTVTFTPGPSITLSDDVTICEGETFTINAVTDATDIRWTRNGNIIPGETSKTLVVDMPGSYTIFVTGGPSNCTVSDEVIVTVNPIPFVSIGENRTICEGESLTLDAGNPGDSYVWTLNNNLIGNTKTIIANMNGTYRVVVTNEFDCEASSQMFLTVSALPTLEFDELIDICDGEQRMIVPVSNGTTFQWFRNGMILSGETNKNITISQPGTYRCVVLNAAGCENEKATTVTSRPSPSVNLGNNQNVCPNETVILDAGVQTAYLWSNGMTTQTISINTGTPTTIVTQTYSVTVTNQFNCSASELISITISPVVKAEISSDQPGVCNGDPVTLTASGGLYYVWSDPTNTLSVLDESVTIANPIVTTSYTVEVSDDCPNNKDSKTIEIKVFEPLNVSAGKDTSVIIGRTIKLNASGGVLYQWGNTDLIVGSNTIANPEIRITEATLFFVTITDVNGCKYVDEVFVDVVDDPLSQLLAVSAITPNGDGANDVLEFIGLESVEESTLKIYNRWGNQIFESFNYQKGGELFDGTKNGERLPADTYYYVLTFDGQIIKSSLTIVWD